MVITPATAHSTTGNPLSAGTNRPFTTDNLPSSTANQPFTTANQPFTTANQPSTTARQALHDRQASPPREPTERAGLGQ